MREYIHYGCKVFNKDLFREIRNESYFSKPIGGFWASPVRSKYGWKRFCSDNDFRKCKKSNSFTFTLKEDAKVIHIYSVGDLEKLPMNKDTNDITNYIKKYFIDFEELVRQGYDAIELHLSEERDRPDGIMTGLYYALYGWDCDSILIMNPDIVVPKHA